MNKRMIFLTKVLLSFMNVYAQDSMLNPPALNGERSIVVVTASYNNKDWYKMNLDSVFQQNYQNYKLIYVDDCSQDGTGDLVEQYIKENHQEHRVTLIKNKNRVTALPNLYHAIHLCNNRDIIVILDGDDFLAHANVLKFINDIYADSNVWLTYGQFIEYPNNVRGFCRAMPDYVTRNNSFRSFSDMPSHLRTFYAGLFKKIKIEDLMYEGDFFKMTYDMAMMLPMIEMARYGHFRFIDQILYIYNSANQLNDHKINKELQRNLDLVIRSRQPYAMISSPL